MVEKEIEAEAPEIDTITNLLSGATLPSESDDAASRRRVRRDAKNALSNRLPLWLAANAKCCACPSWGVLCACGMSGTPCAVCAAPCCA